MAATPRNLRLHPRKGMNRPRGAVDPPQQSDDQRRNALLWLALAEGRTRDALVERLAQARLTEHPQRRADVDPPARS
jgi:hypothetical protein